MSAQAASNLIISNILSARDAIIPLKWTTKGNANVLAVSGDFGGVGGVRDR